MKLLILLAFVGFATASQAPTCEECNAAVDALHQHLITEESLGEQKAILIAKMCPVSENEAECEELLSTFWDGAATVLYDFFFTQKEPCGEMGMNVCNRDWTCEDCTAAMTMLDKIMNDEVYVAEAVAYLQGDAYCGNGGEHLPDCAEKVAENLPTALKILSEALYEQEKEL